MNAPLSEADIRASIRAARETRDAQTRARLQPLFALSTLPKPGELARLAREAESEQARVSAANSILDRAYGKPAQAIVGGDEDEREIQLAVRWLSEK